MGFPTNMFPVLFAIGRMPGWLAHWKEAHENPKNKIGRPRQIYTGPTERKYVALEQRTYCGSALRPSHHGVRAGHRPGLRAAPIG